MNNARLGRHSVRAIPHPSVMPALSTNEKKKEKHLINQYRLHGWFVEPSSP